MKSKDVFKNIKCANKVAQQGKVPATKPGYLSFILRTHMLEGESPLQAVLSQLYEHTHTHTHSCTKYTKINNSLPDHLH